MRFTWIALPVLLATFGSLVPERAGSPDAGSPVVDPEQLRTEGARGGAPIAVLSARANPEVRRRITSPVRHAHTDIAGGGDAATGVGTTARAQVRLRAVGIISLDFITSLSHSVLGFLPSYATVCPPPRAA